MRMRTGCLCLALAMGAGTSAAQQAPRTPTYGEMYCSGIFTTEAVPYDTYLISGEDARVKTTFAQGDYVYLNKGSAEGVKAGDEFLVMRPARKFMPSFFPREVYGRSWFRWEAGLRRAMGEYWKDAGRIRVVVTQANTSIAQVVYTCEYLQRGDYARPFAERPAPPLKPAGYFDRFAPPSGRATAMVVAARDFATEVGAKDVIYVNLGSGQGVKVGDYFRIFRYQGSRNSTVYQDFGYQYKAYGYGRTPKRYKWNQLPREVLGEGIVLRVSPTASTVLVTNSLREIYLGNYVELEAPEAVAVAAPAPAPEAPKNRAPVMRSCSADRPSVVAGERVRITANAYDPDGDPLSYAWRSNGGQIVGSGAQVALDTTGLPPGIYTVTGQANDGRGGTADCTVEVKVQPAPAPAQASKLNECFFRTASAGVDNVCKRILDDVTVRLKNDPRSRAVLIGYADPAESGAARLATQRTENAKKYLGTSGIAESRVDVRSAGGQAGAGRQNRRLDIVWVPAGATY